jgi:hypothetical protein
MEASVHTLVCQLWTHQTGSAKEEASETATARSLHQQPYLSLAADFVPPFGESSEEIRYLVPHGGHDCCQGAFSLVESYVEYPPYPSELSFSLSPAASGEQLLDEPLTGRPVGSITGASKVTVLEMRTLCTDPAVMPGSNCLRTHYEVHHSFLMRHQGSSSGATIGLAGFWARVKTADGQEGWLLLSVRILGV